MVFGLLSEALLKRVRGPMMVKIINAREINKVARLLEYPKPNLPTPAVLVVCCLIDSLARHCPGKTRRERFGKYVENKMKKTFQQLQNNDAVRSQQISNLDCSSKEHRGPKCATSIEILYSHVRCGLVHNYFGSEGYVLISRPNKKQEDVIVDQSRKHNKYALVLNGPSFVRDFLATL